MYVLEEKQRITIRNEKIKKPVMKGIQYCITGRRNHGIRRRKSFSSIR
mgnify:CR=1 FL=1